MNESVLEKDRNPVFIERMNWLKRGNLARCQWLTPAIPATQEAEIRSIEVQTQANSS
jgi:hypothetical protein